MTFSKIKYPSEKAFNFYFSVYNQYIWGPCTDSILIPTPMSSQSPSCFLFCTTELLTLLHAALSGESVSRGKDEASTPTTRADYTPEQRSGSPFSHRALPLTLQRLRFYFVILGKKIHLFYKQPSRCKFFSVSARSYQLFTLWIRLTF